MRSDCRTPVHVRLAAQRDIDAGKLTAREIAAKYGLGVVVVSGWYYNRTPQWVVDAMRVRPAPRPHVMPWVTQEMLTGGRAPVARARP